LMGDSQWYAWRDSNARPSVPETHKAIFSLFYPAFARLYTVDI
jgi:hypothetical protein